jgi:hypothetical protein
VGASRKGVANSLDEMGKIRDLKEKWGYGLSRPTFFQPSATCKTVLEVVEN